MKPVSLFAIALSLALSAPVFANDEHHPEKAAAAQPAQANAPTTPAATVRKMQGNLKKMQAQLDRAAKAESDEERQKVMAEHVRTMQENMQLANHMQEGMMDCASMHEGMAIHGDTKSDRMQQIESRLDRLEKTMTNHGGTNAQ